MLTNSLRSRTESVQLRLSFRTKMGSSLTNRNLSNTDGKFKTYVGTVDHIKLRLDASTGVKPKIRIHIWMTHWKKSVVPKSSGEAAIKAKHTTTTTTTFGSLNYSNTSLKSSYYWERRTGKKTLKAAMLKACVCLFFSFFLTRTEFHS